MKKQLISFLLTCAFLAVSLVSNATIHYVYPGGRGLQDGTSWANAAPDIQYLLTPSNFAVSSVSGITYPNYPVNDDTIFVAGGTYNNIWLHCGGCYYQGDSIEASQFCRIHFYGGFRGSETSLDQRIDWTSNPSIIDAQGDRAVWFEDTIQCAGNVVFDGFIVTGAGRRKEAFRIVNTNAWISHVIIKDNRGIPFFIEHLPYYPNTETYSTATLTDVVVRQNDGLGWPASFAVSSFSQLKVFNSTIIDNSCDSSWWGLPPSFYFSMANMSVCFFMNSIVWGNKFGDAIADGTFSQYRPGLYYQFSIIEHISDPYSAWAYYGHDLGYSADINPMVTFTGHLLSGSPAINFANYKLYPYFQRYLLYLSNHPFAFWYLDADNKSRFGFDYAANIPLIDAGAYQFHENREKEEQTINWLNNTDITGGNVNSDYFASPAMPTENDESTNPVIVPTSLKPLQTINIFNVEGQYTATIYDINGRVVSRIELNDDADIAAPIESGFYLVVLSQNNSEITKETIFVK